MDDGCQHKPVTEGKLSTAAQELSELQLLMRSLWQSVFSPALTAAGEGLTQSGLECLRFVGDNPNCSAGQLAQALQISPAAGTKLIDRLVAKGLVRKTNSPVDRRIVTLNLTTAGNDALQRVEQIGVKQLHQVLEGLSTEDREVFFTLLRSVVQAAAAHRGSSEGICLHCGGKDWCTCPLREYCRGGQ